MAILNSPRLTIYTNGTATFSGDISISGDYEQYKIVDDPEQVGKTTLNGVTTYNILRGSKAHRIYMDNKWRLKGTEI